MRVGKVCTRGSHPHFLEQVIKSIQSDWAFLNSSRPSDAFTKVVMHVKFSVPPAARRLQSRLLHSNAAFETQSLRGISGSKWKDNTHFHDHRWDSKLCMNAGISWGLYFTAYNQSKKRWQRWGGRESLTPGEHLLAAAEGGAVVCLI